MKRIFVPTRSGSDWQRLLAKPVLHWKKAASAMTTAAAWEAAADRLPPDIVGLLESANDEALSGLQLLAAIPEWEVPLEGGDTASHTDVMAFCSNAHGLCIVGVEAKVNEDFGPTIAEKKAGASVGQGMRLRYLHDLLRVGAFADNVRYQLLHRTASALLTARAFHAKTAVMLVQSFGSKPSLRADFGVYCDAMGAQELAPDVYRVASPELPSLYLAWCNGDKTFLTVELPSAH